MTNTQNSLADTNAALLDASLFDPASVDPAMTVFNSSLVGQMQEVGWVFPPESVTALRTSLGTVADPYRCAEAQTLTLPTYTGGVDLRVIPARHPSAVFLHAHPGGWAIGGADQQDAALERIARVADVTVVSVDYRLAPEHPYPAGLDDCEIAARWLMANAQAEFGASRLLIGGESAGANLALCTLLRVNATDPGAVGAASLYYGNYDLTQTPSQLTESGVLISRGAMEWFFDQYVPDPASRRDPDISPLYANLRDLPPVLLTVGSADALLDDTLFLACRMLTAGVAVELQVVPGGEHSFDSSNLPAAQNAVARSDAFLREHANSQASGGRGWRR